MDRFPPSLKTDLEVITPQGNKEILTYTTT